MLFVVVVVQVTKKPRKFLRSYNLRLFVLACRGSQLLFCVSQLVVEFVNNDGDVRAQFCSSSLSHPVPPYGSQGMADMDLDPPSHREIELEMLLRERDTQVMELSVSACFIRVALHSWPAAESAFVCFTRTKSAG